MRGELPVTDTGAGACSSHLCPRREGARQITPSPHASQGHGNKRGQVGGTCSSRHKARLDASKLHTL